MTIYICDDNSSQTEYIKSFTKTWFQSRLSEDDWICSDITPQILIRALADHTYHADIILLDIRMGEINGIDIAKHINLEDENCQIIFLTAYLDYAPFVYEAEHIYFVLKNQMEEMLPKALEKAWNQLKQLPACLTLNISNYEVRISLKKILFIEKMGHRSTITTTEKTLTAAASLKALEEQLDPCFVRCHGSYIVNLGQVDSFSSTGFLMKNGMTVPIGRSFQQSSKKAYLDYLASLL